MTFQQPSDTSAFAFGESCPTCGLIRRADSNLDTIGGHPLHVEGGSDVMWRLVAHLQMLHREMDDSIREMRAETARLAALGIDAEARPHPSKTRFLIGEPA
ncbi:MAG: hypothetical protein H0X39_00050 [Actinobacteria bacterium]|nr:hypothetical protein [Actinomycetota bacterium]